jgi:uncharacterized protein YbjT (DUF2867 family)
MDPILVTGGTGTLGRHVVARLQRAGRDVRVLTRKTGLAEDVQYVTGDLLSGAGLAAAVEGVSTIVHCAGSNKGDEVATRNLVEAAARAGQPHIVNISVVGAERMHVTTRVDAAMFGYFDMKQKQEQIVAGSGLPWTTLRATQFHDLLYMVLTTLVKLPVVPVPTDSAFQPVDSDEVAERMVGLALDEPAGLVPDFAGPRAYLATNLARDFLRRTHRRRPVLPIRLPGEAARLLRGGATLPIGGDLGKRTWEDFLAERLA